MSSRNPPKLPTALSLTQSLHQRAELALDGFALFRSENPNNESALKNLGVFLRETNEQFAGNKLQNRRLVTEDENSKETLIIGTKKEVRTSRLLSVTSELCRLYVSKDYLKGSEDRVKVYAHIDESANEQKMYTAPVDPIEYAANTTLVPECLTEYRLNVIKDVTALLVKKIEVVEAFKPGSTLEDALVNFNT